MHYTIYTAIKQSHCLLTPLIPKQSFPSLSSPSLQVDKDRQLFAALGLKGKVISSLTVSNDESSLLLLLLPFVMYFTLCHHSSYTLLHASAFTKIPRLFFRPPTQPH
jgi:hypothetical protein